MKQIRATVDVKVSFLYKASVPDDMDYREMVDEAEEMVLEYLTPKLTNSRRITPISGIELRGEVQHVVPKRSR